MDTARTLSRLVWLGVLLALISAGTVQAQRPNRSDEEELRSLRREVREAERRISQLEARLALGDSVASPAALPATIQLATAEMVEPFVRVQAQGPGFPSPSPWSYQNGGPPGERDELDARIDESVAAALEENPDFDAENGRLQYGYDDGFFIGSRDGHDDFAWLLVIGGRVQVRHAYFANDDGPNGDVNTLELERARLSFEGFMFDPSLEYEIQLDGDSDDEETVEMLDYVLSWDFGQALWHMESPLGLRIGKWKSPFGRQETMSSSRQQFVDRSMANEFFNIDRNIGVGLWGEEEILGQPIWWEAALLNGFDTDGFAPSALDRNFGYAARVYTDLLGEFGSNNEPDIEPHVRPALRVGASGAFTRFDHDDGFAEFRILRATDSGARLSDLFPPALEEYSAVLYGADLSFKYCGFSLHHEWFFRHIVEIDPELAPELFDYGFYVQGGYFLVPEHVELVARWSRIVGDSGTLGLFDESADEVAGGINYYIFGHDLKLQFDVAHFNGAPVSSSSANIRPGDDGFLFRTQLQAAF